VRWNSAPNHHDPSASPFEPQLARTAAQFNAGLVLNHMRGTPETWAKLGPIADPIGTSRAIWKHHQPRQACGR